MYNLLHNSMNQELLEKHIVCNQSAMKLIINFYMKFRCESKPLCTICKSTLFTVSKDELGTV